MAKRRRLSLDQHMPQAAQDVDQGALPRPQRAPIAGVAGEASGHAAEAEMAQTLERAVAEGRLVRSIPIDRIEIDHLVRDRMALNDEDMETLKASLSERGQQTPIEVVETAQGGFGLISGLRRLRALQALGADAVLAVVKRPESSANAYRAMIEENEIRADLSFYERANIAVATVEQGVYPTPKVAVSGLFKSVSASKRSKILRFVVIQKALSKALRFPAALPEKLGLTLAAALETDKGLKQHLAEALRKSSPKDAQAERLIIERALSRSPKKQKRGQADEVVSGVNVQAKAGRVVLSGEAVDEKFLSELRNWILSHAKKNAPSN